MTTFQPTTICNSPNERAVSATTTAHPTAQRYLNASKKPIQPSSKKQAATPA